MPMYECLSPVGTISDAVRPELVKAITRVHCDNTGAPSSFVHVAFQELPVGCHYTDNNVDPQTSIITGNIRAGRSIAVRQKIMKEISAAWSELTGQPESELVINISEVNSETVMEFGLILPAPGHERAWMTENADALQAAQS